MFESLIKLHYSQTRGWGTHNTPWFESLIKLHYSQTRGARLRSRREFESLIKLHYSQTTLICTLHSPRFESLIKLHYSQTLLSRRYRHVRFESLIKLHYSQTSNQHSRNNTTNCREQCIGMCISYYNIKNKENQVKIHTNPHLPCIFVYFLTCFEKCFQAKAL